MQYVGISVYKKEKKIKGKGIGVTRLLLYHPSTSQKKKKNVSVSQILEKNCRSDSNSLEKLKETKASFPSILAFWQITHKKTDS